MQEQGDINAQLQKKLDEIELKQIREEWIANNNSLGDALLGGGLIGAGGSVLISLVATSIPVLGILAAGATGGSVKAVYEIRKNSLREALEKVEQKYLASNPDASKKEAFEYAKGAVEEFFRNEPDDYYDGSCPDAYPDSWS